MIIIKKHPETEIIWDITKTQYTKAILIFRIDMSLISIHYTPEQHLSESHYPYSPRGIKNGLTNSISLIIWGHVGNQFFLSLSFPRSIKSQNNHPILIIFHNINILLYFW